MELVPYLLVSFGHPSRIDYGTGHETSFVVWLCELPLCERLVSPLKSLFFYCKFGQVVAPLFDSFFY